MSFQKSIKDSEIRKVQGPYGECSYSVVVPIKFLRVLEIGKGDYVRVSIKEDKKIVITKI